MNQFIYVVAVGEDTVALTGNQDKLPESYCAIKFAQYDGQEDVFFMTCRGLLFFVRTHHDVKLVFVRPKDAEEFKIRWRTHATYFQPMVDAGTILVK